MLHNPGVTEVLARFVVDTRWDDLPPQVAPSGQALADEFLRRRADRLPRSDDGDRAAALAAFSGGKQATLIGRRERIDALGAAFLNAAGANVLDFCDTHVPTAIHPTAPLVPALLALAELKPVSGRDLLLAFVLGQEVECRIGLAMSPSHYNKGWHITATCGVFGAAAGSGKLLALSPAQMVWALGTAATQAAGLCECLGTPAKSVGVGNAARNGLWAALLAAQNFAGPAEPLNGVQGYYHALGETPKLSRAHRRSRRELGDHGDVVQALSVRLRHASGARLRAGLAARQSQRCGRKVVVTGNPLLAARADRPNISTGARIAGQRAARGRRRIDHRQGRARTVHRCLRERSGGAALRGKVEVVRDENYPTIAAAVEITTADGKTHKLSRSTRRAAATPIR